MSEIPYELGLGYEEARSGLVDLQDGATQADRRISVGVKRFEVYDSQRVFVREQSNVRLVRRITGNSPELLE